MGDTSGLGSLGDQRGPRSQPNRNQELARNDLSDLPEIEYGAKSSPHGPGQLLLDFLDSRCPGSPSILGPSPPGLGLSPQPLSDLANASSTSNSAKLEPIPR